MPTLVVQMGHAGRTSGATGAPGEQAFTQAVGAACARLLDGRGGWRVRPIVADPALDLYRGDAFVAVHADGSSNPDLRGASVGYQNVPGDVLAQRWREAYVHRGFTGPWHGDNYTENLHYYYGVTNALKVGNARACIIEAGTITNAEDRVLMLPDRVALAIGDAVVIPHGVPVASATAPPTALAPLPEGTYDMIAFTVAKGADHPSHCGLLFPDGRVFDLTDDAGARDSVQHRFNTGEIVEVTLSQASWARLPGIAPATPGIEA